jgi:hypothetical protein
MKPRSGLPSARSPPRSSLVARGLVHKIASTVPPRVLVGELARERAGGGLAAGRRKA